MLHRSNGDTIQSNDVNLVLKPDFHIYKSGATVYAVKSDATTTYSGTDVGAALQAAIDSLGISGGTIVFARDTYTVASIAKLPVNLTGWLRILGNGSTITLGSGDTAGRFLDLDGTSVVGDTFRKIEVDNFIIDATALSADAASAGERHVAIGNYGVVGGLRRNLEDIRITRLDILNCPDGNSTRRFLGVFLHCAQSAVSQGLNTIKRITIEDIRIDGCWQGVSVIGSGDSGYAGLVDVELDEIVIRNIRHDTLVTPASFAEHSHVHIASVARAKTVTVENVWGKGSRDVAVEVDGATNARIRNIYAENTYGFVIALVNFQDIGQGVHEQETLVENVHGVRNAGACSAFSAGLIGLVDSGNPYGKVKGSHCSFLRAATAENIDVNLLDGELLRAQGNYKAIQLTDSHYVARGADNASAGGLGPGVIVFMGSTGTAPKKIHLERVDIRIQGGDTSTGATEWHGIRFDTGEYDLVIRDCYIDWDYTPSAAGTQLRGVLLSDTGGADVTTMRGTIDNMRVGGPTLPAMTRGVLVPSIANLTLDPSLRIVDCDFSELTSGEEIVFAEATDVGNNTATKVIRRDNFL